jgi:hypothetical protein
MSKGRHRFTEVEFRRAVRAAKSAGIKIVRVEIEAGKISIIPENPDTADCEGDVRCKEPTGIL